MADGKRYGGRGNRNPDGTVYDGHRRPWATRPIPPDFRERYLEMGWEAEWYFETNWRVMRRWIDEAGGEELIAARAEWLKEHGRNRPNHVRHVHGWTAEKLSDLHR